MERPMPRLRKVDSSSPGFTRRRRGRGFEYLDERGRRIDDETTVDRLRALAIPPAWAEVWICPLENGHLQAVGTDAAGRRQYLYHPRWREHRDREKFDHMIDFAESLPRLRRVTTRRLRREGLTRDRVLACAVRLLDLGFFRIGGEEYAEDNGSYGLATLEKRHVELGGDGVLVFDYVAKGGQRRRQTVVDPDVHEVVAGLKRRRGGGDELLAYKNGRWTEVRSSEINDFIKEITGDDFTAKDFRTWHATVLAAVALAVSTEAGSKTARERAIRRAVEEVAHYLGNTPAVCRASYIDPRVFDRYRAGDTIADAVDDLIGRDGSAVITRAPVEKAVLDLIQEG
jgi:DNA topoisomerase IB